MGTNAADDCYARLRLLQAVAPASGLDSLLLVGGVDGKNHPGSRETLNWLITGLSGRDIFGFAKLDSALDEVVLLIGPDAVCLYAPNAMWTKLQPCLGRWRRLRVWTPPADIEDDVEKIILI